MKDMFNLDGRVAVVTGGAGLIGYALAQGLATFGAHTFIADINEETAEKRAAELRAKGCGVQPLHWISWMWAPSLRV